MMKYFGEFLVEQGHIDNETLLTALVHQLDKLPSIAHFVYEHKLLPVNDQLRVFHRQWRTGGDYRQACIELKLWNSEIEKELLRLVSAERQPLGQILIEEGRMTLTTLSSTLDEFVAAFPAHKSAVSLPSRSLRRSAASLPKNSIPKTLDPVLIEMYSNFYDGELHTKVFGSRDTIRNFHYLTHALAYITAYVELYQTSRIWQGLVHLSPSYSKRQHHIETALELTWGLRGAALDGVAENDFLVAQRWQSLFDSLLNEMEAHKEGKP